MSDNLKIKIVNGQPAFRYGEVAKLEFTEDEKIRASQPPSEILLQPGERWALCATADDRAIVGVQIRDFAFSHDPALARNCLLCLANLPLEAFEKVFVKQRTAIVSLRVGSKISAFSLPSLTPPVNSLIVLPPSDPYVDGRDRRYVIFHEIAHVFKDHKRNSYDKAVEAADEHEAHALARRWSHYQPKGWPGPD